MRLGRIFLHGFLIWVILFFIGWLLMVVLPHTRHIILLILALVLVWIFSLPVIDEKKILVVGVTWLLINFVLDLIFIFLILGNEEYYSQCTIWVFYVFLLIEPAIVKRLFKNLT